MLIAYLRMKVDQADWHAVSDAANDLRVLEAEQAAIGLQAIPLTEYKLIMDEI